MRRSDPLTKPAHRRVGAYLFNRTWDLLATPHRTRDEDDEMLRCAHASRYHWSRAGRPLNFSIGEWQLSRVYSTLGRAEPAAYHAERALEIALHSHLSKFYVAYGYEALARAHEVAGRRSRSRKYVELAARTGKAVRDSDSRRMLTEDLDSIRKQWSRTSRRRRRHR